MKQRGGPREACYPSVYWRWKAILVEDKRRDKWGSDSLVTQTTLLCMTLIGFPVGFVGLRLPDGLGEILEDCDGNRLLGTMSPHEAQRKPQPYPPKGLLR